MKKFEYKVEKIRDNDYSLRKNEQDYLNYMGEEGWELVNIDMERSYNMYPAIYHWKREKKRESFDSGR